MESGFYQLNQHVVQDAQCSRKLLPRLNAFEEKPPKEYKDHGRGPDVLLSAVSARSSPISAVGEHSSASNANAGAVFSGKNDLMMSSSPEIRMQRGSQNDFELEKNFCHHAVKRQREIQSIHEHPIDFSNNLPRALIQAYGSSKPSNSHPEMPSKFQKLGDKRMRTDTTIRKWKNSEEEEYLWDNMSPTLTDPSIHMKPTKHDIPQGTYSAEACLRKSNASTPSSWSMPTRHNTTERTVMLDQREAVNGLGQRPGNGEYNVSAEKGQYLHSQSIYRGRDSWTADHMQSSKVPAQSSGLPTVCHRRPPSNYPTGSDALMQRPVNSQSDSVDTASLPSLPPASANNHVLRQTYIPSSHSMHPFKAELPSQSSSIPLKPFQYAGHSNSVGSGKSMLRHGTSLSPSTFSNDTYREPSEPRVLMAASGECSVLHPLAPECHSSVPQSHFLPRESCGNKEPPARTYDAVLPPGHLAEHVQISSSTSQFLSSPSCDLHPSSVIMGRKSGNPDLQYGGALPSLPPRMHTNAQMQSAAHNTGTMITNSAGNGHIGLISSLISKGLISLPSVAAPKDFVSLEFNHEHLKARNQSVVDNLYDNIPRQCRTCGLRFRCQEKHSTHMDWHVTKNRVLKNCKQKPSRKWFVSAKEWLSGAETLGIDPAPGFLTAETITERREDNEMAVPADVNQKFCALCGEAFEDFFSDEADEWMYKEAVYLNSQERRVHEYGRSLLGPIVHAKCRPISSNK